METLITSGNTATGSSGSVTYSIGQVFYTYFGNEPFYNVAQGIQQQEKQSNVNDKADIISNEIDIIVYPNPTTDYVTVNISDTGTSLKNKSQSYQLFDVQGRVLKQNIINQSEIEIDLTNFSSSLYILQFYVDNKVLKTIKLLKK